jgi:hypothetical protein
MARLLRCIVDSAQPPEETNPASASKPNAEPAADLAPGPAVPSPALSKPEGSLWERQWRFLRQRWWNVESLSLVDRIFSSLRGVVLIAIGAVGLIVVVTNTLNLNSRGMDAVAKLMAEFLLIPVGLLALIIAGYGLSQIVRSFIPNSVVARHALDQSSAEEAQSEKFQLRDEDQP